MIPARACLAQTVQFSEEAEVKCPYRDKQYACDGVLQEREIKAVSQSHRPNALDATQTPTPAGCFHSYTVLQKIKVD